MSRLHKLRGLNSRMLMKSPFMKMLYTMGPMSTCEVLIKSMSFIILNTFLFKSAVNVKCSTGLLPWQLFCTVKSWERVICIDFAFGNFTTYSLLH